MKRSDVKKLAPDLRLIGPIERALVPKFHAEKSAKMNNLMRKFLRGKWFGHHSVMREDFIERADGSRQRVLIVHPKGKADDAAPGLLWMHGGGYGIGMPE